MQNAALFAALFFELSLGAFCLAALAALPWMKGGRAFAVGFLLFGGLHFLALIVEPLTWPVGWRFHYQLLTFVLVNYCPWGLFESTETSAFPGRGTVLALAGVQLWGVLGGFLAVWLNRRKRPNGET